MNTPLFRRSLETQSLVKLLTDDSHDPTFTYAEMSAAIGKSIQDNRSVLSSAMHIAQQDRSLVFETIRGVGIKRATDAEIVSGRTRDIAHVRATARRGLKKLECVKNVAGLTSDNRTQLNVLASGLAVLYHTTTNKVQGVIEQHVVKSQSRLAVDETLAALNG